jgi:hypothetical protein
MGPEHLNTLSLTNSEHLDVQRWKKYVKRITADRILTVSANVYMWSEVYCYKKETYIG